MPKRKRSVEPDPQRKGKDKAITRDQFEAALKRYSDVVPEKLKTLDEQRYETIPRNVASREPKRLLHDELVTLVEWKLKHGTFRPALLGMARAHDPKVVEKTTQEAFQSDGMKKLTTLRGIGPATASLLLSCADPAAPFFSDELYRWMVGGKIGYTMKEYAALREKVAEYVKQHKVTAMEMEKVAYVLERE